jgi:uncharacterized membrane protein YphA (DoxX/SURF4 family)
MDNLLPILALAARVCLGLVFLVAGIQKMRHWQVLEGVISNYRLLPFALVKPAASVLPVFELLLGAALLAGFASAVAAATAILLLLVFAAAMAVNIRRGRTHIDCGCHQSFLRQTLSPVLVVRNVVLAALLLPAALVGAPLTPAIWAVGIGAGIAFFLFYVMANVITSLPVLDNSMQEHSL